MTRHFPATLSAIAAIATLGLSSCGGATTTTVTNEVTTTLPAETTTVTARAPKPSSKTYSGNGLKNLGTIEIPTTSTLKWTNDGALFQIFADDGVLANSQAHSGDTVLDSGTYTSVKVNAIGNWTLKITEQDG